ncbi:MAG TPA: RNA polymerase factor sigma-54 [Candidatus Krumholzibacteria bacterium]|nr:RNA polymerase factor sigma-54 [Candidatus Krumholzibacteria bacterium]
MDVKLRLHQGLYQKQQLVMTQRLQQALKLLQIPTLELEQVLRQELQTNPLLEELDPLDDEFQEEPEEEEAAAEADDDHDLDSGAEEAADDGEAVDWDEYFQDGFKDGTFEREHDDEDRLERPTVATPTGQQELMDQLVLAVETDMERRIGEYLIGSIDASGFLTSTLEEVAATFEIEVEEVEKVLRIIQDFDPPGVGARDIQECLILQLRAQGREDSPEAEVIRRHFEDLKNRRFTEIARAMGITPREVQEIAERIGELDPKPGMSMGGDASAYITPDLVVEKVDDDYVVYLNDGNLPRLRVSNAYDAVAAGKTGGDNDTVQFIDEKRRYAEWIIKTIEQRRRTMIKVMEAIVREQRDFFELGPIALRPLTLQQVASTIGMHESTVSRVTKSKYCQTPRGVFPLKYFFSAGLDTDEGDEVAAKAVKEMIQEIVGGEDPARPLSDKKIVDLLSARGLKIARRTVAKYREQLGILNARMRKRF